MKVNSQQARLVFVLVSILLHLLGVALLHFVPPAPPPETHQEIAMEILERAPNEALLKSKEEERLIVDQEEKALNNELDDSAKFLSAHNQKVVHQTMAQQRGEFKNRKSLQNFFPQMDIVKAVSHRAEMEEKFDQDADFRKKVQRHEDSVADHPTPDEAEKGSGPVTDASQTLDRIKELDPGLETLLSTKEFKFYTYFSRIRQQLNQHWTPRVREKVGQIYKQGRRIASSVDIVTRCLVTLDPTGRLLKVQIIGDSGYKELDEAAVESFRSAAPFPNPPKGMVDPDGTIKIRWDFILEA